MAYGLLMAHSGWRHLVILVLAVALVRIVYGLVTRARWVNLDDWLVRLTPIMYDVQVLLGLVLWLMQQRWTGVDALRSWEHPATMLLAVLAAHFGTMRVRKTADDAAKFRTALLWFLISGALLTVGVLQITGAM